MGNKNLRVTLLLGISLVLIFGLTASNVEPADAASYLKIDGIKGETIDQPQGKEGQIEILSFAFGVSSTQSAGSKSGGAGTGKPIFSEISISKTWDSSSIELFKAAATGANLKEVELTWDTSGEKLAKKPALTIKLENVIISSYSLGGGGENQIPTENISLVYGKISMEYNKGDGKGDGKGTSAGWDITKNEQWDINPSK